MFRRNGVHHLRTLTQILAHHTGAIGCEAAADDLPARQEGRLTLELFRDLGAKLAAPDRQVVAVCGDGGFQMTMMELATMKQYKVPVKIVVLRNNVLGLVRQYQHFTYQDRYSVIDLGDSIPDFKLLAEAYGIRYLQIAAVEDMDSGIEDFLSDDEATLLEVIIDPKLVV